jgi:type IV pilus assembly protein PilB
VCSTRAACASASSDLGFLSDDQASFEKLISLPDGIILVTGPTGSGKTTTLYACLNFINRPDRKIITVEDPVEYELAGINQVMVKEDVGMTFAAALRAMLRQAPNIIMLGEIRDLETASIAIQASLTGHLVFPRCIRMTPRAPWHVWRTSASSPSSSPPPCVPSRPSAWCASCAETVNPPPPSAIASCAPWAWRRRRLMEATDHGANGCGKCRQRGFRGRMSLVEIFKIDDEVRTMINQQLTTPQLRKRARELGMRTMREDGIRKVLSGMTTADEVIEATMSDSH